MAADPKEFEINPEDFTSTVLNITFVNNTTNTATRNKGEIRIVEFYEKGFLLEMPAKACASGHNVSLMIEATLPDQQSLNFEATGKVEDHQSLENQVDQVKIILIQYQEENWIRLNDIFSRRQDQIEKFFAAVKGY